MSPIYILEAFLTPENRDKLTLIFANDTTAIIGVRWGFITRFFYADGAHRDFENEFLTDNGVAVGFMINGNMVFGEASNTINKAFDLAYAEMSSKFEG